MQGNFGESPSPPIADRATAADAAGWETEIKFDYAGDVASLQRALNVWPRHRPKQKLLRSVYYDTADHDLRKNGITLRVRGDGNTTHVLGVKFAGDGDGGPFRRGEVEAPVPDGDPRLDVLPPALARKLERLRQKRPLMPLFETRVTRTRWVVAAGVSVVEVVLDEGEIILPDGRTQSLREIEFELKDGRVRDLFDLARIIAGRIEVSLAFQSKSDRGFAMLGPGRVVSQKSTPIVLKRRQSFDDAIEAILSNTLHHFVGNWTALRQTDAPEAVHQLRVSLRRMRSAFKVLRHVLQTDVFDTLREDARQIAAGLGPARELDSFIAAAAAGPLQRPDKPAGCETLMTAARALRSEHLQAARATLNDRRSTLLVLRLQCLLSQRGWNDSFPAPLTSDLAQPARDGARRVLDRLQARVLKKGRRLASRNDTKRHDLRIALKDLRYGMEFFASLFKHPKRCQKLLKSVGELQDSLGKHNDAIAVDALVRRLSDGRGPDAAHAAGYLIGWHAHEITVNDSQLHGSWEDFKLLRPFWRKTKK